MTYQCGHTVVCESCCLRLGAVEFPNNNSPMLSRKCQLCRARHAEPPVKFRFPTPTASPVSRDIQLLRLPPQCKKCRNNPGTIGLYPCMEVVCQECITKATAGNVTPKCPLCKVVLDGGIDLTFGWIVFLSLSLTKNSDSTQFNNWSLSLYIILTPALWHPIITQWTSYSRTMIHSIPISKPFTQPHTSWLILWIHSIKYRK